MIKLTDKSNYVDKSHFDRLVVVNDLSLEKPVSLQNEVVLYYHDHYNERKVTVCHGLVTLFYIPFQGYFLLASPEKNTDEKANSDEELQACIGNQLPLEDNEFDLLTSLQKLVRSEMGKVFTLDDFSLSCFYVVDRIEKWNLCYIKIFSLFKQPIEEDKLKMKITAINDSRAKANKRFYGIYKLDDIVFAAKKTAPLSEGKKNSNCLFNFYQEKFENHVILDDRVVAYFFS